MKILLIDNYDSFTYNLYHYLSALKCKVEVYRNNKIEINKIKKSKYQKIVISPGPGNPDQAGNCLKIVKHFYKIVPILGVCLATSIFLANVPSIPSMKSAKPNHKKAPEALSLKIDIIAKKPITAPEPVKP